MAYNNKNDNKYHKKYDLMVGMVNIDWGASALAGLGSCQQLRPGGDIFCDDKDFHRRHQTCGTFLLPTFKHVKIFCAHPLIARSFP